jgi:hypothetical protein
MPLLRTETIHGWVCKFYDNDRVMVGTTARRFSMNVPADDTSWVATRLRAERIERELATAEELPIDEAGEAAMEAKAAARARGAAAKAAFNITINAKKAAAAALAGAEHDMVKAEHKRGIAELKLKDAMLMAKVAKLAPMVSQLAQQTPAAAPLQARLESFFRRPVG